MKLLYIAVHHHKGWGAEHWLSNAFERKKCKVIRYDYRSKRNKLHPWWLIKHQLATISKQQKPDAVLIQRAEKMPASIPALFDCPTIFWSTEPLIRRRDTDTLLRAANAIDWFFLHTYTCSKVITEAFPTISEKSSVLHNAGAIENHMGNNVRPRLAVFNRNVSDRRRSWLDESADLVEIIEGQYGERYFQALRESQIAVNIHFAEASLDDFETGIFEALASGCAVVTETLNPLDVADMGMEDAVMQVGTPTELRAAIEHLRDNPKELKQLQRNGQKAMDINRWDNRAEQIMDKFTEIKNNEA
ncbi:MAG: glycosyltransferase [Granulosicoccaceae bacterium]